ncbi:Asp23/Gls24 family envelope stress response protein [Streptomyces sp. NA04227]|uniref:Asp23/Gls24 family envelope stress response protein n=1 Tax=Streptomyces sp. NA04227 TaxID=2742136 RepID=UPI00158FF72C|nr:Asp23/Gls24 family envelope stress response protein [Streptomyces sp. NA04227]QKW10505.1 Asp23/Gls24 family envelope stress response protein [Streptomyces sp. NA04227]
MNQQKKQHGNRPSARSRVEEAVAAAAAGVPGVAYLRPGLVGVLRAHTARLMHGVARPDPVGGVRAALGPDRRTWQVEVKLTTLPGHRAVDVTREVRAAATAAAREVLADGGARVEVTVTVTGVL